MSRPASRSSWRSAWQAAVILALAAPLADAQTIADYSRAQRAFLESAMAQAAARSAGPSASAPALAASSAPAAPVASPSHAALLPPSPSIQVSGVFAATGAAVAEIVVDSTPYLLEAGERVPGTAWQVQAIAVDRVVLARRGSGASAEAEGGLRVFPLPALH